jgi:hypothetical protein
VTLQPGNKVDIECYTDDVVAVVHDRIVGKVKIPAALSDQTSIRERTR